MSISSADKITRTKLWQHDPGPMSQALNAVWREARFRLWHPRFWWRHLRLRSRYDLDPIQLSKVTIKIPHGVVPDCHNCQEVCCTGHTSVVSLRLADVATLVDAGLQRHITHHKPSFSIAQLEKNTALHHLVQNEFWSWFPILTQDETQTCTLLGKDLQCSAYPAWPHSCARFPYSFNYEAHTIFYAGSCHYSKSVSVADAPLMTGRLVRAAIDAYNQRIRDIILVHVAAAELEQIGLLEYLRLPDKLLPKVAKGVKAKGGKAKGGKAKVRKGKAGKAKAKKEAG